MKILNHGNNYSTLEESINRKPGCTTRLCAKVHGDICDLVAGRPF